MNIVYPTTSTNVPTVATSTTALADSAGRRIAWSIQNQDASNPLLVCLGSTASSSVYHYVLPKCTSTADGTGGMVSQENGVIYTGIVTVYSAGTPSYTVWESKP